MIMKNIKEIESLRQEKDRLILENKRLRDWIDVLTTRNKEAQVRIQVLEGSIRNFGLAISDDIQ